MDSIFDLSIPQPAGPIRKDVASAKETRKARVTRDLVTLLEGRRELRGVYGPADSIAETLRWSA